MHDYDHFSSIVRPWYYGVEIEKGFAIYNTVTVMVAEYNT